MFQNKYHFNISYPGKGIEKAVRTTVAYRKLRAMIRNEFALPASRSGPGRQSGTALYWTWQKESQRTRASIHDQDTCSQKQDGPGSEATGVDVNTNLEQSKGPWEGAGT